MKSITEKNKQIVQNLYRQAFLNNTDELIRKYFHHDFIQHNPWLGNGIENVSGMHLFHFHFQQVRVLAQKDLVAIYGYYRMEDSMSEMAMYGVDIWRLEDGKIAEHWDVLELLPLASKNIILGDSNKSNDLDQDQMIFNTGLVNTFSYLAFSDKDVSNLDSFICDDFAFHYKHRVLNPEEFKSHLLCKPDSRYEIRHLIASDDYVIIHSHFKSGNIKKAGIEIYRTNQQYKIEEMWSLSQELIHVNKAFHATTNLN